MSSCTMIGEPSDTVVLVQANIMRIAHVPASPTKSRITDTRLAAAVVAAYILETRSR